MKNKLSFLAAIVVSVTSLWANPSEINYQGVLTDQQGNPINGVRAMQIKLYDAPTGGTLLYSEDLGNVPVQDGIYSFAFGANGTSNALTTETIAIANGTVSTFQKVLAAPTVVAGSVTVSDGTYTWDQANGSSNESDFSVAYSPNLRRVTVTYYKGPPAAGKTISAKFRAPGSGIPGALAEDNQPWIEVSLAGVAQTPRQKVLTVPFAVNAGNVNIQAVSSATKTVNIPIKQYSAPYIDTGFFGMSNAVLPCKTGSWVVDNAFQGGKGQWQIPNYVKKINSIKITYNTVGSGTVNFGLFGSSWPGISRTNQITTTSEVIPLDLIIPLGENWVLGFNASPATNQYGRYVFGTGAEISAISINAVVSAVVIYEN